MPVIHSRGPWSAHTEGREEAREGAETMALLLESSLLAQGGRVTYFTTAGPHTERGAPLHTGRRRRDAEMRRGQRGACTEPFTFPRLVGRKL